MNNLENLALHLVRHRNKLRQDKIKGWNCDEIYLILNFLLVERDRRINLHLYQNILPPPSCV